MDRYERPHRKNYSVDWVTGTEAAGLGAGGVIFIARNAPANTPNTHYVFVKRLIIEFVCTTVFTVPLTQRQLSVWRGSGAGTAATAIPTAQAFDNQDLGRSFMASANGGDMRVATTGTVNVGGVTFEARPLATMQLTHVGNAGNFARTEFNFCDTLFGPPVLAPGECITVRTAAAFDAGGTWIAGGWLEWCEELIN